MRIAMLHLSPRLADLDANYSQLSQGMRIAAEAGAEWIVTPELCLCGYRFAERIGTSWIAPWPDIWGEKVCRLAASLGVTVFMAHPERESATDRLFNTVFVIGSDGNTIGVQRKTHVIPGSEAWASRADTVAPVMVPPVRVGILVCADVCTHRLALRLCLQGAGVIISAAAWGPHLYGPAGEWEARSRDTGLPIFVCNRAGTPEEPDFMDAESVIVNGGRRIMAYGSSNPTVLVADWNRAQGTVRLCGAVPITNGI